MNNLSSKIPEINEDRWEELFGSINGFEEDTLRFFFSQAEKKLEAVIKIAESFRDRALRILIFIVPALLAVFGYSGQHMGFRPLILSLIFTGLFLMYSAWLCLTIINTRQSTFLGCAPSRIISMEWIGRNRRNKQKQTKEVILNECRSYQVKIEHRIAENDKVGRTFREAIAYLFASPAVAVVVYLLFSFARFV
ncbi:MAG: hypothetical protein OXT65_05270 [Alphaproteobacteria bacterium]|nr:hypothetical protein [Alphaproteobacteria bacterium]